MKIESIIPHFHIPGKITQAIPFGSGHINDTFRLFNSVPGQPDLLLQKINHHVFKEVTLMMENINLLTTYFKNNEKSEYGTLTLIPTTTGSYFHKDAEGNYWRVYEFLKDLVSYDKVETTDQIYEGAKAFGDFLQSFSEFPIEKLHVTIPKFHHVISRLNLLQTAIQNDTVGRAGEVQPEIEFIEQVADKMCQIQRLGDAGKIPLRVTHNDTKFNNVMLDRNGKGRCVIDLDTVMPGFVHFDFGDGVRTTISNSTEDEADLNLIQVDVKRFEAFASGYLEAAGSILAQEEIQYLPLSGALLAYLMGVRFLTDYLEGDVYYKIHFEGQNLQRARSQLDLCKKIMQVEPEFKHIIKKIYD